jgi:hypothetical protein
VTDRIVSLLKPLRALQAEILVLSYSAEPCPVEEALVSVGV